MITISEIPSNIWSLSSTFDLTIDRSSTKVAEYLQDRNIKWLFRDERSADVRLYKADVGPLTFRRIGAEMIRRFDRRPGLTLIGEPRELAPAAYSLALPKRTLAVAPGNILRRLYYASEWLDPKLEEWQKRADRLCWIARPTPERIAIAAKIIDAGIPLDIYSRERWPVINWKGFTENETTTAENYRYRIVCENSCRFGYHSEKLFNSIRSGCVTFYRGDPLLDLSHADGSYLPLDIENIQCRGDLSDEVLQSMNNFMFSEAWEVYSFKKFFDRIITLAKEILDAR